MYSVQRTNLSVVDRNLDLISSELQAIAVTPTPQVLTASAKLLVSALGTSAFYGSMQCFINLPQGLWRLYGMFLLDTSTNSHSVFLEAESGFYAKDGSNSATQPSLIAKALGYVNFSQGLVDPTGNAIGAMQTNTNFVFQTSPLICFVTNSNPSVQPVYLVPRITYTAAGSSFVRGMILAESM